MPGRLGALLEEGIREGLFAGAGAAVLEGETLLAEEYRGFARLVPDEQPAGPGTLWDLASLTKPLAGAALLLALAADRALGLDDPLARFSDLYRRTAWDGITLRRLLLHDSGLPAWFPCYVRGEGRRAYRGTLAGLDVGTKPGTKVVYSCLGYLLLADVVETASGSGIPTLFRERVASPLGVEGDLLYVPPDGRERERAAGGERDDATERRMVGELGLSYVGFRKGVVNGEPNDGNAWRRDAGASLNAGLFGTVRAVARAAGAWLGAEKAFLPPSLVAEAIRAGTPEGEPRRGLGWQLASPANAAGEALSPDAFGHTGFTGTSLFSDPASGRVAVLLANRLHERVPPADLNPFRRRFHALAAGVE